MSLQARHRIICFKIDIRNDLALLGSMRLEPMQRYYHARHGQDYIFAADYSLARLKEHFAGAACEFIEIIVHKAEPYVAMKKTLGAFSDALSRKTGLNTDFMRQAGASGRIYRAFINNYFKLEPGSRYLELGAHDGTAFLSALWENSLEALAVDDWTVKEDARRMFMNNLMCTSAPESRFGMLDKGLGAIFPKALAPRNALFCFRSCMPAPEILDDILEAAPGKPALLVVDSWNFGPRREDWLKAIAESRFESALSIAVRTSLDEDKSGSADSRRWANGYLIALLTPKEGVRV